jgi:hypothetical protein
LIGRLLGFALALSVGAVDASAQIAVNLRDPGRGPGPQILVAALAGSHMVVGPASAEFLVRRDTVFTQTLVVLGRTVVVEGTVHGDLIVVGGDLYMHPNGQIDGNAVTIGGGVYESTLARIGGKAEAFRDVTYDIAESGTGYALTYRSLGEMPAQAFQPAGFYGLLVPTYDRTNGLSIPIGLDLAPFGSRFRLEPRLTGRSQLGRIDPSVTLTDSIGRGAAIVASVGRSTYSNDAWINTDIVNSLAAITVGNDTRNYFRGTRGEASIAWRAESDGRSVVGYVGARGEHGLTVRPGVPVTGGPWSFRNSRDIEDMFRPNPPVNNGVIASAIAGTDVEWNAEGIVARAGLGIEAGRLTLDSIAGVPASEARRFVQATFDGVISFPTFGLQSLRFEGHAVVTSRGTTPLQRWVFLGGSGTISTLNLLELGGDQLIYFDGRYSIPLERVQLPIVGSPVVTLRDAFGGAAVGGWPTIHQAIGVRLSLSLAYIEYMIDPVTRVHHVGFGFSLPH